MHHHIQRGKVRSQVINVPEGLPELLSDITREVLRCQPTTECLCQFVINYLHSIIVTRDKARVAKSIIDRALRTVDEIIEDMCICDITKTKSDQISEAMEECFKRFLAKRRCEKGIERPIVKFNEFDMLDELIKKCKFSDDELLISRPVIEAAYKKFVDAYMLAQDNAEGTESMYQYFLDREIKRAEQFHRAQAAIKIQATFRGYAVRRTMLFDKSMLPQSRQPSKNDEEMEQAARTIQQFFRNRKLIGHKETVEKVEPEVQEVCTPVSNVSLTAHPAGYQNLEQEGKPHDGEEKDNIIQDEQSHSDEVEQVDNPDATVEEVNVEIQQATEETTVQFEIHETNEENIEQVTEEITASDEAPNE